MFIWDSSNIAHIALHSVSSDEAEQVINNDPLDIERQFRNGEARLLHLGETLEGVSYSSSSRRAAKIFV